MDNENQLDLQIQMLKEFLLNPEYTPYAIEIKALLIDLICIHNMVVAGKIEKRAKKNIQFPSPRSVLSYGEVDEIRQAAKKGIKYRQLMKQYNCSYITIYRALAIKNE